MTQLSGNHQELNPNSTGFDRGGFPDGKVTDIADNVHPSYENRDSDCRGNFVADPPRRISSDTGLTIVSIMLAGILFYGGLGWLADRRFGTSWILPIGAIFGIACSVYVVIRRYGSGLHPDESTDENR